MGSWVCKSLHSVFHFIQCPSCLGIGFVHMLSYFLYPGVHMFVREHF